MRFYMKPVQWERILSILRTFWALHTKNTKRLRRFMEAVWYVNRTGCQRRLLPEAYGKWRSVHARFKSWDRRGIWQRLFESVQEPPDLEAIMIDATIVRAHACAAGYRPGNQAEEA